MLYISIFSLFLPLLLACSDEFSARVQQFKYDCQKKQPSKMYSSADSLVSLLQEFTKDNCKNFDKSANAVTIENLYTFVKFLGAKRDVPLYKDWLLYCKPGAQKLLETRQDIFQKIYPSLKILHKSVQGLTEEVKDSDAKKPELSDEDLVKNAAIKAAQIQRYLLFSRDSKLYHPSGSKDSAGIWFKQKQMQLFESIVRSLEKPGQLSSPSWCRAAALLAEHLFVIESTGKEAPLYHDFKNLYQVQVMPYCSEKNVMIPSSLLIPQVFLASQFSKKNYFRSDHLTDLIDRVNSKLFAIHEKALSGGVEAIDGKMRRFVFQVALLNHYFVSSKFLNANGFKAVKRFEKAQGDLRSNLDEIFKLLKIS